MKQSQPLSRKMLFYGYELDLRVIHLRLLTLRADKDVIELT